MKALLATAAVFILATSANATTLTADADDFSAGTDISNSFAGLTLSFEGQTSFGITDGTIYSVNEFGALWATTGTRVFGTSDPTYPHLFAGATTAVLRVDFDASVWSVSLDALADDVSDFARFRAYNSADVLLGTFLTSEMTSGGSETMTLGGGDIAYVLADSASGDAVGFDNLVAQVVPVPAAVWLFGSALGALGWVRRKAH